MHTFTILCLFILAILSTKAFGRSLRGDDTEGEEGAQSSMASSINKVEEKPIIAKGHDKQIIKATNIMAKALGDKNVAVNTERTMKKQKFTKDPDSIKRTEGSISPFYRLDRYHMSRSPIEESSFRALCLDTMDHKLLK